MFNTKVKVYKVWPKDRPDLWYLVDAPTKRIAKWCGTAIINNSYCNFLTAKHMEAERFQVKEDE